MDYITLDFETAYRSKQNVGTPGPKYSLSSMTYEEYIFNPLFKIHGVGIKVNDGQTQYYRGEEIEPALRSTFAKPVILICHNTLFDGAILYWVFGLTAVKYYCTQAMATALWPQFPASLHALSRRLFPNDASKWKGEEVELFDGHWTLTPELETITENYCIQDIDVTFECFREMWKYFPEIEFEVMHLTLRMFIEPTLKLDVPKLEQYLIDLKEAQRVHIHNVLEKENLILVLRNAAERAFTWTEKQPFELNNPLPFIEEVLRAWKHAHNYALRKPRKKDTETVLAWMAHIDEHLDTAPHAFCFMAARVIAQFGDNEEEMGRKVLSSSEIFAQFIDYHYSISVPRKHSPTPKNPNNYTWALAKDDLEFLAIQRDHQDKQHVWEARLNLSSTIEQSRAQRLLDHYRLNQERLAVPLKYCGAHTKRWSGTNNVNFQNFGRLSPIRHCILPPEGYWLAAPDLSNIESRVLAWFAECTILNDAYAEGRDIYSEFATDAYKRPINRKRKAMNEAGQYLDKDGNVVEESKAHSPDYIEGLVGKVCILGLGYGMSAGTLQTTFAKGAMGAPQLFFSDEFCDELVNRLYRKKYPEIPALWDTAQRVIADMANPNLTPYAWKCLWVEPGRLRLPNGMYLTYPRLKMVDHPDCRRPEYVYWNGQFYKKIYGGLLVENIIQALSRILIAEQLVHVEHRIAPEKGRVTLTVHDELVFIIPKQKGEKALQDSIDIMRKPLPWCDDGTLTLDAEGALLTHYQK